MLQLQVRTGRHRIILTGLYPVTCRRVDYPVTALRKLHAFIVMAFIVMASEVLDLGGHPDEFRLSSCTRLLAGGEEIHRTLLDIRWDLDIRW